MRSLSRVVTVSTALVLLALIAPSHAMLSPDERAGALVSATEAAGRPADAVVVNGTRYRPIARVPAPPRVVGRSWAAVDIPTGRMLAVHLPRRVLAPGSTMKLLTALTAVRRVAPRPRHRITHREAGMICSCAGLVAGRRYARNDLLAGLLVPSGNDAAEALAGADPVGRRAFIAAMNRQAKRLSAADTHAGNPSGLDHPAGYSTARDLLVMVRAAYRSDRINRYLDLRRARIGPLGGPDHLVAHRTPYVHHYPASVAAKSGTTSRAGKVLVAITWVQGRLIGVSLMGSPGERVTTDVRALASWAGRYRFRLAPVGHLP